MILTHPAQYNMVIQVHIPPALCAVHNFIRIHDDDEIHDFLPDIQRILESSMENWQQGQLYMQRRKGLR